MKLKYAKLRCHRGSRCVAPGNMISLFVKFSWICCKINQFVSEKDVKGFKPEMTCCCSNQHCCCTGRGLNFLALQPFCVYLFQHGLSLLALVSTPKTGTLIVNSKAGQRFEC